MSSLKFNTTLVTLDIQDNRFRMGGAVYISELLAPNLNSTLKNLDISRNKINPEGVGCITQILATNTSLQFLGIQDAALGVDGVWEIAASLVHNVTISTLALSENAPQEIFENIKNISKRIK